MSLKAGMMRASGTEFMTYTFAAYFFYLGNESLLSALALMEVWTARSEVLFFCAQMGWPLCSL